MIPLAIGDTPASVTKGEFRLRYLPQKRVFFDSSGIATKLHVKKMPERLSGDSNRAGCDHPIQETANRRHFRNHGSMV